MPLTTDLATRVAAALGDRYVLERELGGGGMSRVFLAQEAALGRRVVVKVLREDRAAGVSAERFRREVMLAAGLQHPHLLSVLHAGDADGTPFYIMPYVDGESLRQRLEREGRLPIAFVVSVLRDVARALAFAHERGIVHRDVKPDNVLLAGGSAVVADLGIAKAITSARDESLATGEHGTLAGPAGATITQVGTTVGTPAYMAPEQWAGDPSADHRVDLYALGVMAWELLAGEAPFAHRSGAALMRAHLTEEPPSLAARRPEVTRALEALVQSCLAKDPAGRPASAEEVAHRLADPAVVSGAMATAPTLRAARRERAALGRRVGLALAGLAAVAGTAWLARTRPAVGAPAAVVTTPSVAGVVALDPRTVAIVPFVAIDDDSTEARAARALVDDVSTALVQARQFTVPAPSTVQESLDRHPGPRAAATALRAAHVVEGTVQREGNVLRIAVRLVRTSDGSMVWADVFEGPVEELLTLQSLVGTQVRRALGDVLGADSAQRTG